MSDKPFHRAMSRMGDIVLHLQQIERSGDASEETLVENYRLLKELDALCADLPRLQAEHEPDPYILSAEELHDVVTDLEAMRAVLDASSKGRAQRGPTEQAWFQKTFDRTTRMIALGEERARQAAKGGTS